MEDYGDRITALENADEAIDARLDDAEVLVGDREKSDEIPARRGRVVLGENMQDILAGRTWYLYYLAAEDVTVPVYRYNGRYYFPYNTGDHSVKIVDNQCVEFTLQDERDLSDVFGSNYITFDQGFYLPEGGEYDFQEMHEDLLAGKITNYGVQVSRNVLAAAMITQTDTDYIIPYAYDLNEQTLTLPTGAALVFAGGKLYNGTLAGQGTAIDAPAIEVLGQDVSFSGTWHVAKAYPEWFGIEGSGTTTQMTAFASLLGTTTKGLTFYNTDENKWYFWTGTAWEAMSSGLASFYSNYSTKDELATAIMGNTTLMSSLTGIFAGLTAKTTITGVDSLPVLTTSSGALNGKISWDNFMLSVYANGYSDGAFRNVYYTQYSSLDNLPVGTVCTYPATGAQTNRPTGEKFTVLTCGYSDASLVQIAICQNSTTAELYVRTKVTSWSTWTTQLPSFYKSYNSIAELATAIRGASSFDTWPTASSSNPVTSGGLYENNTVISQAVAQLQSEIEGINEALQNLGDTKAKCIDSEELPKVCGQSLVVTGSGAPSVVPMFVGQRYHDTTNKKVYEAMSVTNSTSDWVILN